MSNFPASRVGIDYGREAIAIYETLQAYLDKKTVKTSPMIASRVITFAGASFVKIPSTVVAGDLAVGSSSTKVTGGVVVASVAGSFATGSLEIITNSDGEIMNMVAVRNADTNEPIFDGTSQDQVFGLLQSSSGTADGTAIGGIGVENMRLQLAKYDNTDTLTAVSYTGDVEFEVNKLYSELTMPSYVKEGRSVSPDIVATTIKKQRKFIVTNPFVANEVITISTGAGATAGACTVTGDTILLPSSAGAFNINGDIAIFISQGYQSKGSTAQDDVTWVSTNSFSVNRALDIDEVINIIST